MMKNYHTHTTRCYHAIDSEEEYIQKAMKAGFSELGFSDHTPWHYASPYHSHMRMEEDKLEGYVNTLLLLKEKYKDQISIKIGLECEYFPQYIPWLKETLEKYHIDYIILGNHFDDSDEDGIYFGYPLTKKQFTKYVDNCIAAMETGLYSYIAHPDIANYDTSDPFYKKEMKRLCLKAKECDMPVEFNLLGFQEKRQYPNEVFFSIAKEVGNKVILGVDAHESDALANTELFQTGLNWLKERGLEVTDHIRFLTDNKGE